MRSSNVFVAVGTLLFSHPSAAHVVSFEPQALADQPCPAPAADDYSADTPRVLDNVWGSKVIFGYLCADDVDFFEFTLTAEDTPALLSTLGLTPACAETVDRYVNVALMGPGLPAPEPDANLPFTVPDGMGVLIRLNPELPTGEARPIFDEPTSGNTSFLPLGPTNDCIWNAPWECDWTNTLAEMLETEGTYLIAAWDSDGEPQDYSLSVGTADEGYYYVSEQELLCYDNAWLHEACTVVHLPPDAAAGAGGASGSAGATGAEAAGQGGIPPSGSAGAAGGSAAGATGGDTAGAGAQSDDADGDDGSCSCSVPGSNPPPPGPLALALLLGAAALLRRR